MNSTVTQRFSDAFDTSNETHVKWLGKLFEFAKCVASSKCPVDDIVNGNPMKVKVEKKEMIEWVHIHFCLAMKYSRDVISGVAWVPPK
jgi:hypothetical protein